MSRSPRHPLLGVRDAGAHGWAARRGEALAAAAVLPLAAEQFPSLQKVWVDAAYAGPRVEYFAQQAGLEVEVVKRSDQARGFVVQAKRWIVERTLGWLVRERRMARDYERKEESAEAFVYLGMIRLMLGRLA